MLKIFSLLGIICFSISFSFSQHIQWDECNCGKSFGKGIKPVISFDNLVNILLLKNNEFESTFQSKGFTAEVMGDYLGAYQHMNTIAEHTDCYNIFLKSSTELKVLWSGPSSIKPFFSLTNSFSENGLNFEVINGVRIYKLSIQTVWGDKKLQVHLERTNSEYLTNENLTLRLID